MPRPGQAVRNTRTRSTAAAFVGVIGVPDPGYAPRYADAGLEAFCQQFNRAADQMLINRSHESRAFVHAERQAAAVFR